MIRSPWFVCLVLALSAPFAATAQDVRIQSSAVEQINALLAEKAARSPAEQKIDSDLLLAYKLRNGDAIWSVVPQMTSTVGVSDDGTVLVDIFGLVGDGLTKEVVSLGGKVINSHPDFGAMRARVPLDRIVSLAESADVDAIKTADELGLNKINTSEGDVAHAADVARNALGIDGSGVDIGVLSDSIESLASLQGSGDLPAVSVVAGQAGSGTSEGTAMLEIVYDLAPGASLHFATANGGQANFAANILALAAAGCDVIVDDVFYFSEPVFQDGPIAQAVETVNSMGIQYYSAVGNGGNLDDGQSGVWEGDFTAAASPPPGLAGQTVNSFGGANANVITADPPWAITLFWSDAWGASGNDYDLFVLDPTGTTVLRSSTNVQSGSQAPYEAVASQINNGDGTFTPINDTGNLLVVVQNGGAAGRYMHLNTIRGRLQVGTSGQAAGHPCAVNAFGTAAVNVATAGGGVFTGGPANPVETFSSDGLRRVFYDASGTPLTPGNFSSTGGVVRQKPDIAAADGVTTATPGFAPFFGTSAAAPHAAAIGGLLLSYDGSLTPNDVRTIFTNSALDIEGAGFDRDSGVGIVMADLALQQLNPPPVAMCQDVTVSADADCQAMVYPADVDNGSYDPDGETITLSLEPAGPYSLGNTNVTLTVEDEAGWTTTCDAVVTVVDDTPPVISCPSDVTVECNTAGGVEKTDDQLAAFFAGVSATDNCDNVIPITNDAPDLLTGPCSANGGVTTVTFTATDDAGNTAQCSAQVTVIDTTAPTFTTLLPDRDTLWPPNHKMVDITMDIAVADACDDDPAVVLVSITSSQPDNGHGDGDTVDDIQGAATGTDDRAFQLRSERSGGIRDGRTYTITYSVTDCSGNTSLDSVAVRVPHDRSGTALALEGFTADGTALDGTRKLSLVVPSIIGAGDPDQDPGAQKDASPMDFTLDAAQVLADRARVGNTAGALAPLETSLEDVDKDGATDLILVFDSRSVAELQRTIVTDGPVGLHFSTEPTGGDWLAPDIFLLGPPLEGSYAQAGGSQTEPTGGEMRIGPNPFNPQTTISFSLSEAQPVSLVIYNQRGEVVRTLVHDTLASGDHEIVWSGRDDRGAPAASGFYLVRFEAGGVIRTGKISLLK